MPSALLPLPSITHFWLLAGLKEQLVLDVLDGARGPRDAVLLKHAATDLAQAEGEAEAFDKVYAQYRLAPEVTRQRLYYETMERVLSQTDKTIVETDNVTPYLPLPEIRRRSQQPVTTVTAPEGQ